MDKEESLESRIEEARKRLEFLEAAKARKDSKIPCPNSDSHERLFLNSVVWGGIQEKVKEVLGLSLSHNGYQIHRCLVCQEYLLMDYDGSYVGIINEKSAKSLLHFPFELGRNMNE